MRMENLLEMVKNDRNAREFLHECYMEDPDHIGTGFSRWLAENEDVLPVYLECMEQIDGGTGSPLESFVLARTEDGKGKPIQEANSRRFNVNENDRKKLEEGDPEYVAVFEIVKEFIYDIVEKSIKSAESAEGFFKTMIDSLENTHSAYAFSASRLIDRIVSNNADANKLIINKFGSNYTKSLSFSRALLTYIAEYAYVEKSNYHDSLWNIIKSAMHGSDINEKIDNFTKWSLLNALGTSTRMTDNESVEILANILDDVLPKYQFQKDDEKTIKDERRKTCIRELIDAMKNSKLSEDVQSSVVEKTKTNGQVLYGNTMFARAFKMDKKKLAQKLLIDTEKRVKAKAKSEEVGAAETNLKEEHGSEGTDTILKTTNKIINKINNGFENLKTEIKSALMGEFIQTLLEEYELYKKDNGNDVDMGAVLENTGFTDPCSVGDTSFSNNFGNALMDYIFGISKPSFDNMGHRKLKKCIEIAIETYKELRPELDTDDALKHGANEICDLIYKNMIDMIQKTVGETKDDFDNLKGDPRMLVGFKPEWKRSVDDTREDQFEKDAYEYMFERANLGRGA